MDEQTRRLWREADAATMAEAKAELAKRPGREIIARIGASMRAWRALARHRKQVHRQTLEREAGNG